MKLTKKLEKEILEVYNKYWDAYLKGNMRHMGSCMDEDCQVIGSGKGEVFKNKKEAVKYYTATADQVAGKSEMRNRKITVAPAGDNILVTEESDFFVLMAETWTFYGAGRLSTLFAKKADKWLIIQQHGSLPDARTGGDEQINTDKIKEENIRLKDAVKRRTIELENKNRELEIEGALQRIRAEAVAMKESSDLLDIVVTMRNEFTKLGHEAHYFWHMMWLEDKYEKAMTSGDGTRIGTVMELPRRIHGEIKQLADWENSDEPIAIFTMDVEATLDYVHKMGAWGDFQRIDPNMPSDDDIRHIGGLTYVMARTTHGEIGFSLPGEVKNPPAEALEILEHFAGAFDLAHQRFLDLQKTEKQTREVQIELALEKVRSRTMAMRRSDELQYTAILLFQQFDLLGIPLFGCGFNIWDEDKQFATAWMAGKDRLQPPFKTSSKADIFLRIYETSQRGESLFVEEQKGEELETHYMYMATIPDFKEVMDKMATSGVSVPSFQIMHCAFFPQGYLMFISHEDVSTAHDIFIRFAKVFEQTYTRFLDLQKAEAQAREAEIQLALERVRARAMAMQKSNELSELVDTVFKELTKLDMALNWCMINLIDDPSLTNMVWAANPDIDQAPDSYHMKFEDYPFHDAMLKAYRERKAKYVYTLEGKEKRVYDKYLFSETEFRKVPEEAQAASRSMKKYVCSFAFSNFGGLQTVGEEPLSSGNLDILARFGEVFDLTYTRFNDLLKAEAQAREAQIEAALERVRSRSMAMRDSDELADLSFELVKQVQALGVPTWFCAFNIYDDDAKGSVEWGSNGEGVFPNYRTPREGIFLRYFEAGEKGESLFINEIGEKECPGHYEYLCTLPGVGEQLLKMKDAGIPFPTSQIDHVAYFKYGYVLFITFEPAPHCHDIFIRFAKVFEQTYTRFLDLQKAEAQTREAQIENALEKVRSRTMAMQHSDELPQAANVLFLEVQKLGIPAWSCGYNILADDKRSSTCIMSSEGEIQVPFVLPLTEHSSLIPWHTAILKELEFFVYEQGGDELVEHYNYMATVPGLEEVFQQFEDAGISLPTHQINHLAKFTNGFLLFITYEKVPEAHDIFKRFARVFEQTYTRFLDLQKAEAQARDAQIEAALERTRTQSMLMQHSDELDATSKVFHEQLRLLGIETEFSYVWLPDEARNEHQFWVAWNSEEKGTTGIQSKAIVYPLDKTEPYTAACFEDWESGIPVHIHRIEPNDVEAFFFTWEELLKDAKNLTPEFYPNGLYYAEAFMKYGCFGINIKRPISDEEQQILQRFSIEFERTYTRFLDLQKAEAQAREAQIETALERVRSASMAMHQSRDLHKVIVMVYNQLESLGLLIHSAQITESIHDRKMLHCWIAANGQVYPQQVLLPFTRNAFFRRFRTAVDNGESFFTLKLSKKQKDNFFQNYFNNSNHTDAPKSRQDFIFSSPGMAMSVALGKYTAISIMRYDGLSYRKDESEIVQRFTKVFEQSYTRFLDLKKAESQAREAQIEAALERVRAASMAMHQTNELKDVIRIIFDQLAVLNINAEHAGIVVDYKPKHDWNFWVADKQDIPSRLSIPYLDSIWDRQFTEAKEKGQEFYATLLNFEEKNSFYEKLLNHVPELTKEARDFYLTCPGLAGSTVIQDDIGLYIENFSGIPYSDEDNDILKRFGRVFQQAYTRFLDLQKAEAQTREVQIEAALERVRSRSMAMHKSDELLEVGALLYSELSKVGIEKLTTGYTLLDEDARMGWSYGVNPLTRQIRPVPVGQPHDETPIMKSIVESWKKQEAVLVIELNPEETIKHQTFIAEKSINFPITKEQLLAISPEKLVVHTFNFSQGYLVIVGDVLLNFEQQEMVARFAKVFEQTYTRFLDLQKAEAQAREAQIEAALERVRSKTMAMHSSEDVDLTVVTLFDEVLKLGLDKSIRCGIGILQDREYMETWSVTHAQNGEVDLRVGLLDMTIHPLLVAIKKSWKNDKKGLSYELSGKEVTKYYSTLNNAPDYPFHVDLTKLPKKIYHNSYCFSAGVLFAFTDKPITKEAANVLNRFAGVFGQTYTRFLDLQKAEEQAREAQIEAALERVRSKAMAMRNSEDLASTVDTFFSELNGLGVMPRRCGVGIVDADTRLVDIHATTATEDDEVKKMTGNLTLTGHPVLESIYNNWIDQKEYHPVLKGNEISAYYQAMNPEVTFPDFADDVIQYGYYFFFKEGGVFAWTDKEFDQSELQIFRRYTSVLSLTYRRYIDLVESEAREKEAIKESSLDRVRGVIASMRSTDDLQHITPLIWRELTTLEVPFFRCGVFIIDEEEEKVNTYLSAPDGHSLGVMHLSFDANPLTVKAVESWRKEKVYTTHWDKEAFTSWMQTMSEQGQIKDQEKYQDAATAPDSLDLHFVPFKQGMLYVGNSEPLQKDKIDLVDALAQAFAIAYARYEDFNKIEQSKQQVEKALVDLKQAQSQLVHSEKMASLGELTAGIAHEIQNPLNFVNNFSEVSNELLDEMMEEMSLGNIDEVKEILNDVKQNLEKINHHGKRADGIVKGMLQHSRSSKAEKEPTDLNVLCDEYLRLSYHGLRAKDKSFNASLETDFDDAVGKVNIIPQDMGRVILNLLTNAFFAVNEKKRQQPNNYEPTVSISTKRLNGTIEMKVGDNGNGISKNVVEKIFQPFFTTKPTGQGTGLGLSLSYDIVKAHGGELKVETKEGEGSEFVIQLPVV